MWDNMVLLCLVLSLIVAVGCVEASENVLKLGTFGQMTSTSWTDEDGLPGGGIEWVRVFDGKVHAIVGDSIYVFNGKRWHSTRSQLAPSAYAPYTTAWNPPADVKVRVVVRDASDQIWLATDRGVYAQRGDSYTRVLDRSDGMPFDDLNCIAFGLNGDLWGGAMEGAWRLRGGEWRYFWGKRWMLGNRVNHITIAFDGVWLATDNGVSVIREQPMTMKQKAAYYEDIIVKRHDRHGFITSSHLKVPGKPEKGVDLCADDNDGLWTGMYVAAEAYRYAVTKDPRAKQRARRSFNAILDLVRLSGYPGFPARSIILKGETPLGYDPDETVRVKGETDKIWYKSPTHPDVLCKGDTSSDELNGHYFAWYLYYDLVASKSEKVEIRKVVAAVTDNLLRNDYTLVGHTGRKTRWGVFGPKYLNDDPAWHEERPLNSVSMLCFLKVAYHICGNESYKKAYDDLIVNHHYLLNALDYYKGFPWYALNHSDDELAFLAYYPLLMLEKEPARRAILVQALARIWQSIRPEHSSLYNFIYGATTGQPCDFEEAVQNLRDWPLDLVRYDTRNSHRMDVKFKSPELDRVLPVSERQPWRWNGNPYTPDGGNGGAVEEDGTAWLLPYWMGRWMLEVRG